MKTFSGLEAEDTEQLLGTIEASLAINKRFQFFLWAQGALQRFLPHETLVCAHGDIGRMQIQHETFSSAVFDAQKERDIGDPVGGLLPRAIDDWLRNGQQPRLVGQGRAGASAPRKADFGHVAAHGPREIKGAHGSFFLFTRLPSTPGAREAYLLDLLMPYLHMALYRMLANEVGGKDAPAATKALLSQREVEVLQWVRSGKTNEEIGAILSISPPTVKNHVQKILRKLNASNRAQAVGKATALRLLPAGEPG